MSAQQKVYLNPDLRMQGDPELGLLAPLRVSGTLRDNEGSSGYSQKYERRPQEELLPFLRHYRQHRPP